jgi:hypothetical protein
MWLEFLHPPSVLSCSTACFLFFFLPLPIRDEVMQRGEQLFIPSPPPTTFVCVMKLERIRKENYTSTHHHLEVKTPYSYPSSFITNYTFLLPSSKHVYCSGLLYIILIHKNTYFYFFFSIFYLSLLLDSYF